MEKLYLARRARKEIYGPFPKGELKNFLSAYEQSQDWEICGSLGPWIFLHKEGEFKQHYAEMWQELNSPSFSLRNLFQRKK